MGQQLTVSVAQGLQCASIAIIDDSVAEDVEQFQISISSVRRMTGSPRYIIQRRTATVSIEDDDCKLKLDSGVHCCMCGVRSTVTCSPECVNGLCRHPGVCQCYEGWIDDDCSRG